jgi:hypothetical protein
VDSVHSVYVKNVQRRCFKVKEKDNFLRQIDKIKVGQSKNSKAKEEDDSI